MPARVIMFGFYKAGNAVHTFIRGQGSRPLQVFVRINFTILSRSRSRHRYAVRLNFRKRTNGGTLTHYRFSNRIKDPRNIIPDDDDEAATLDRRVRFSFSVIIKQTRRAPLIALSFRRRSRDE